MAVTPASFRQFFPEFSNPDVYRDILINSWATYAVNSLLDPSRWDASEAAGVSQLDYGTMLFVAHRLALQRRDVLAAQAGGIPGQVTAPMTSKSVDSVSVSYDTGAVTEDGAGQWNATRYGIEFIQLARQNGMGGIQMTGGIGWEDYGDGDGIDEMFIPVVF